MAVLSDMAAVATECVKKPGRMSVWSEQLGRYVCDDDPLFDQLIQGRMKGILLVRSTINPTFKLVFLTSAGGTLLFIIICVSLHILTKGDPPDPLEKLIDGLFDLAKIGFGAVVGLLGAKALANESVDPAPPVERGASRSGQR
jgi:hypothetical protein